MSCKGMSCNSIRMDKINMEGVSLKMVLLDCFAKAVYSLAKIRTANCPSVRPSVLPSFRVLSDISRS